MSIEKAYKFPDDVWKLSEPLRSQQAKWNSDICVLGEACFIRCVLNIPFLDGTGQIGLGVWCKIDQHSFMRYGQTYNSDQSRLPAIHGTLANEIPGYAGTYGCDVSIVFRGRKERPLVTTGVGSQQQLAHDQQNGLSNARLLEVTPLLEK